MPRVEGDRGIQVARGDGDMVEPAHMCARTVHCATYPPSTMRSAPVMNDASSEARKTTAYETSIGWPARPSGVIAMSCSRMSAPSASVIGVSIHPGHTALTRMPSFAYESAADLV